MGNEGGYSQALTLTNRQLISLITYSQPHQGPISGPQTLIQQAESSLCLSKEGVQRNITTSDASTPNPTL